MRKNGKLCLFNLHNELSKNIKIIECRRHRLTSKKRFWGEPALWPGTMSDLCRLT
jgi:hypothetical protein